MGNAAAQTAVGPMVIVAVDQNEDRPLVRDDLARRFLPLVGRIAVGCARWRPLRRMMIAATEKKVPGLWASMLCRKRYIDDVLRAADPEAVVVLGAGFDTRGRRLPGVPVFEVDLPDNIESKRARLRGLGAGAANVTLVGIDFERQNLAEVLTGHGYRRDRRTVFVWEAVTQYLTEPAVRATFDFLAGAPSGSELAFTYVRRDFLDGTALYGAEVAYREFVVKRRLWHFGLLPEEVAGFLAPYGWRVAEDVGPAEYTDRYVAPSGRALSVSEIERCVHAVKA